MIFFQRISLLALALILASWSASVANASNNPNCPAVEGENGPLIQNEAYGFYAFGADSSAGANATLTMVGDIETDAFGCPEEGFFAVNDNGFPCVGTFTSVLSANSAPVGTGSMTWTSSSCFAVPLGLAWTNTEVKKRGSTMYFSSDGSSSALVVAGKIEDNGSSDGPTLVGTSTVTSTAAVGNRHHH